MGLDSLDVFLRTVRDDLGLDIAVPEDADTALGELPGWDSLNLLRLVALLEESGHRVPVHRLLEARSLREVHTLVKEYG
ncbi:phosphopantetheine-binding protein [Streptomyces erythrochromogenes]|uniref:phosphopantetheine-binding protein n=1 Tax=Streptomyces erythrochromogenes TaxID=285574 RepID=UPI00225C00C6|nr:phosphopantetheine-binding protein [Streptomyces erythrochromogenes]MCX5582262.1 phosphopantetheine-binding protein [Streptomyces erythrochromogenes]